MKIKHYIVLIGIMAIIIATIVVITSLMRFNKDITITIEEGQMPYFVLSQIKKEGAMPVLSLIGNKIPQLIIGSRIKIGVYKVYEGQSLFHLAMKVRSGIAERCSFTFIPGKTVYQYKQELELNPDFKGAITAEVKDGEILPDTYSFFCGALKNSVLKHAKEQMDSFLNNAIASVDFNTFYLKDARQIIILASIVEKETGIPQERKAVAAVFKNRLKLGMKLQTDPTVIYQESNGAGELPRPLTLNDLKKPGEYNTYVIPGLPVGAISNPSREAILATISPVESDALYFVANNIGDGRHNFAKSYEEHLQNVEIYRSRNIEH